MTRGDGGLYKQLEEWGPFAAVRDLLSRLVVLVFGVGTLGQAIAHELLRHGAAAGGPARLVLFDRRATLEPYKALKSVLTTVPQSLSRCSKLAAVRAEARRRFPGIRLDTVEGDVRLLGPGTVRGLTLDAGGQPLPALLISAFDNFAAAFAVNELALHVPGLRLLVNANVDGPSETLSYQLVGRRGGPCLGCALGPELFRTRRLTDPCRGFSEPGGPSVPVPNLISSAAGAYVVSDLLHELAAVEPTPRRVHINVHHKEAAVTPVARRADCPARHAPELAGVPIVAARGWRRSTVAHLVARARELTGPGTEVRFFRALVTDARCLDCTARLGAPAPAISLESGSRTCSCGGRSGGHYKPVAFLTGWQPLEVLEEYGRLPLGALGLPRGEHLELRGGTAHVLLEL